MQGRKIHQRGNSYAITIPVAYMKALGWHLGQLVILRVEDDELRVFAYQDQRPAGRQASTEPLEAAHAGAQG